MGNEAGPAHAQQRSSPVQLGIEPLLHGPNSATHEQRPQHPNHIALKLAFHPTGDGLGHAFAGLEHHVADKAITDHHVGLAFKEVMTFDIPTEIEIALLELREGGTRGVITLLLLCTDAEQSHHRLFAAKNGMRVDAPHHRKFAQHLGVSLDIGSRIDQHKGIGGRWHHRGDGRPRHPLEGPQFQGGRSHNRAGIAGREHGIGFAGLHQIDRHTNGGVALAPDRYGRFLVHPDHFRRVSDDNLGRDGPTAGEFGPDGRLVSYKEDRGDTVKLISGLHSASHDFTGGIVATHGVEGYFHELSTRLVGRHGQDLTSAVDAALGASAVGLLGAAACGTHLDSAHSVLVRGLAHANLTLRYSSFWNCHRLFLLTV